MTEAANGLRDVKRAFRRDCRERLRAIKPEEVHRRSERACQGLMAAAEYLRARFVMLFLPLPHEVDARPVARRAFEEGRRIAIPLVCEERRQIVPVELRSLDEPMQTDRFGLQTPMEARVVPAEEIDLVVVPGLGFDVAGRRIGRGGGYYDRFLGRRDVRWTTCGLALDEQVVERVPAADHDVSVEMLVTDARVLRFATAEKQA